MGKFLMATLTTKMQLFQAFVDSLDPAEQDMLYSVFHFQTRRYAGPTGFLNDVPDEAYNVFFLSHQYLQECVTQHDRF